MNRKQRVTQFLLRRRNCSVIGKKSRDGNGAKQQHSSDCWTRATDGNGDRLGQDTPPPRGQDTAASRRGVSGDPATARADCEPSQLRLQAMNVRHIHVRPTDSQQRAGIMEWGPDGSPTGRELSYTNHTHCTQHQHGHHLPPHCRLLLAVAVRVCRPRQLM